MREFAIKCGFKAWQDLTQTEQKCIADFVKKRWPLLELNPSQYYWKESIVGGNEWISFQV